MITIDVEATNSGWHVLLRVPVTIECGEGYRVADVGRHSSIGSAIEQANELSRSNGWPVLIEGKVPD